MKYDPLRNKDVSVSVLEQTYFISSNVINNLIFRDFFFCNVWKRLESGLIGKNGLKTLTQ